MATKIRLKQLSQEILDLINKGGKGGGAELEKDITSNTACGAAPSGTLFPEGQTFTEFAEKILRKDIYPSISASFSGSGLKEVGTIVNGSTITLRITNLNDCTVPINEIRFYNGNSLLLNTPFVQGQNSYTYVFNSAISTPTTLKAELIYNGSSKVNKTGSFNFVYASYYGVTKLSTITDADASNFATTFGKSVKTSASFTWNNISVNDERFLYMYPKSFGKLSSIKDGNGFSQMDSYSVFEVNVTNPINGDIVPYYAYLLTDATTGSGFKQIYG